MWQIRNLLHYKQPDVYQIVETMVQILSSPHFVILSVTAV